MVSPKQKRQTASESGIVDPLIPAGNPNRTTDAPSSLYGSVAAASTPLTPTRNTKSSSPMSGIEKLTKSPRTGYSRSRAWSLHEPLPLLPTSTQSTMERETEPKAKLGPQASGSASSSSTKGGFAYYSIYAIVNVLIGVPGLCK
jgi:hypothetical protein